MSTISDLIYVTLFAVVWPLFEYFFFWPAFLRGSQTNAARARARLWFMAIMVEWGLVALGATLWVKGNRSWASLGFVGALFVLIVALFNSLWPAIALHAVVDFGGGIIAWIALRESQLTNGIVEAELQTQSTIGVRVESNTTLRSADR